MPQLRRSQISLSDTPFYQCVPVVYGALSYAVWIIIQANVMNTVVGG
jgi:hypothetical protein